MQICLAIVCKKFYWICFSVLDQNVNRTKNSTIHIATNIKLCSIMWITVFVISSGPPIVTISGHDVNANNDVSINWKLSGGEIVDFYLVSINSTAPKTPYGGLLNITSGSVTQYELTGFMTDYVYNIKIYGVNCGGQEGHASEPLPITLQRMFKCCTQLTNSVCNAISAK